MKLDTTTRKKFRVRGKIKKVASKDRFRLSISRSSKNIFAQIIDDEKNEKDFVDLAKDELEEINKTLDKETKKLKLLLS